MSLAVALALVAGCGSGDEEPAPAAVVAVDAPVQHRLFRGPADQDVIEQLDLLRGEPGRLLASWTFSSSDDADAFEAKGVIEEARVQDGALVISTENDEERSRALYFRPPVDLPPVFRFEVKLAPRQPKKHFPRGLLWKSARHPKFHKWRQAHKDVVDVPEGSPRVASYEVVYWHGPIKRFRLDFNDTGRPIRIDEISIHAPVLRTVEQGSGGMVWAEIDGMTMPAVWATTPSRVEATVQVPDNAQLTFSTGLSAEAVSNAASSVTLTVHADNEEVFSRKVRAGRRDSARWQPARVDLGPWAGRRVTLAFEASPADDAEPSSPALAFWGAPSVVAVADAGPAPTAVLVVMDTTRADHLSLYGYGRPTTPFLRRLGRKAVVFDAAFSQSPWTMPSMCSMLTSAEPWEMNTIWGTSGRIPGEFPTLAERLADAGFVTGAFVGNLLMAPDHEFCRGFDTYAYPRQEMTDGSDLTDRALEWVETREGEPLFLLVHYIDPHTPYAPPRESLEAVLGTRVTSDKLDRAGRFPPKDHAAAARLMEDYDGEIRWLDEQIRRLYEGLHRLRGHKPLFVVTADHGEAFLEHGFYAHGASLHSELVHVPLLFSWPDALESRRIEQPVRVVDIVPTMLDLLGLGVPPTMAGMSLRPVIDGIEVPLEAYSEANSHGPRRAAVRNGGFTYMTFETWDPFAVPTRFSSRGRSTSGAPATWSTATSWRSIRRRPDACSGRSTASRCSVTRDSSSGSGAVSMPRRGPRSSSPGGSGSRTPSSSACTRVGPTF
jgi:arylsulfatase